MAVHKLHLSISLAMAAAVSPVLITFVETGLSNAILRAGFCSLIPIHKMEMVCHHYNLRVEFRAHAKNAVWLGVFASCISNVPCLSTHPVEQPHTHTDEQR